MTTARQLPPLPDRRWATIADRRAEFEELVAFVRETVHASRMAMDAVVVVVCAVLGAAAWIEGLPLLQWFGLGGAASWAGLRLISARRAAVQFVEKAEVPPQPVSSDERPSLPAALMAPSDARTLEELDSIVRALHAPTLRTSRWIGSAFYVVTLAAAIVGIVAMRSSDTSGLAAAVLGIAAASLIPVGIWSTFAWANQRGIDALFAQVDAVLREDALPAGELADDAAVRVGEDGRAVLVPEHLRPAFRPRARQARRPPVVPALIIAAFFAQSAAACLLFSAV